MFGFIQNTQLLTLNGVKNIQDVETGDVLVGETTLNTVTGIHRFHNQKLAKIKVFMPTNEIPNKNVQNYKTFTTCIEQEYYSICKDDKIPKWRSIEELSKLENVSISTPVIKKYYNDSAISKELFQKNIKEHIGIIFGMFFINGRFIENEGVEFVFIKDTSIIQGGGGLFISDIELVEKFIKNKFGVEPTVCENIDDYYIKLTFMNNDIFNYFHDNIGPNYLVATLLKWPRQQVVHFITGLFTIKYDISPWCPILYFKDHSVANTLCHVFNTHGIECDVHETNLNNIDTDYVEMDIDYINDINNYKYNILLNHTFTAVKYHWEPNSPRLIHNIDKFQYINVDNKEYKFLNVESITIIDNSYDYNYALSLDNDNTYSVNGIICKGV